MADNVKSDITIDVVSDVMCPWCYIGKKRLEDAVASLEATFDIKVSWLPFQLDATLPKHGKDRQQYFIDKFGSLERYQEIYAPIRQAGEDENIKFNLDAIKVSPNTLDAHRMIYWAGKDYDLAVQNKLVGRIMKAYFEDGLNIGDDAILLDAAVSSGMAREKYAALLTSDTDKDTVTSIIASMQNLGISGVPCMIVNKKYAMQGAQSKDNIIALIKDIQNGN